MNSLINATIVILGLVAWYYGYSKAAPIAQEQRNAHFLENGGVDTLNGITHIGAIKYKALKQILAGSNDAALSDVSAITINLVNNCSVLFDAYFVNGTISTLTKATNLQFPLDKDNPDIGVTSVGLRINISSKSLADSLDAAAEVVISHPEFYVDILEFKGTSVRLEGRTIGTNKGAIQ